MAAHKYVTTEWKEAGPNRYDCVTCGFTMLGQNRVLVIRHKFGGKETHICDGCANAVAAAADGKEIRMDGVDRAQRGVQSMTIYQLSWGASGHVPEQQRFFHPTHAPDAAVRFSERVLEMDRNPEISAAWAKLRRLPDSIYPEGLDLVWWTKTSDERRTVEGELTVEATLHR